MQAAATSFHIINSKSLVLCTNERQNYNGVKLFVDVSTTV